MKRISIIFTSILLSCANIVPPNGGANDTVAPKIIDAFPANKTINVKEKEIVFLLDEFVNLNDPQNNIEIYPIVKKREKIIGKKIHLYFEEALRPNTTYLISFNEAVKDFREGNMMENSEYTFSTGPILDTGRMEGFVLGAELKNPLNNITCVLAENKELFLQEKYLMKTKTTENGFFQLKGLKEKKEYALFCFNDNNKDKKWSKDEEIGFAKGFFTTASSPTILLNENKALQKVNKIDNTIPGVVGFVFDANPEKVEIDLDTLKQKILGFEKIDKTIKVYYDTTSVLKDKATIKAKDLKEEEKQIKIISENGKGYAMRKPFIKKTTRDAELTVEENKDISLEWSYPIAQVDTSRIILRQEKNQNTTIEFNQSKMKIKSTFNLGKKYTLVLLDSAVQNKFNQYSKKDTILIKVTKKQVPSNITITITDLDEKQSYVLFNKETKEKKRQVYPFSGKRQLTVTQKNLLPDEYLYYLVIDENKNGRWDKGDFEKDILPETVLLVLKQKVDGTMDFDKNISLNKIKK